MKLTTLRIVLLAAASLLVVIVVIVTTLHCNFEAVECVETGKRVWPYTGPNVFFLETNGTKRHVTARVSCAVESAALQHVTGRVTFYKTGDATFQKSDQYVQLLSSLANVHLVQLDAEGALEGTPLAPWYRSKLRAKSWHPVEHLSDALRLAVLWNQGGIYLDTDAIVLRSLQWLSNSVSLGPAGASNGVLIFDRKSPFLFRYMKEFARDYVFNVWGHQGPHMLSKLLRDECDVEDLEEMTFQRDNCSGINLLPAHKFLPFSWKQWRFLFDTKKQLDLSDSYSVHLYGSKSGKTKAKKGAGSLLDRIMERSCPLTYQSIKNNGYL